MCLWVGSSVRFIVGWLLVCRSILLDVECERALGSCLVGRFHGVVFNTWLPLVGLLVRSFVRLLVLSSTILLVLSLPSLLHGEVEWRPVALQLLGLNVHCLT